MYLSSCRQSSSWCCSHAQIQLYSNEPCVKESELFTVVLDASVVKFVLSCYMVGLDGLHQINVALMPLLQPCSHSCAVPSAILSTTRTSIQHTRVACVVFSHLFLSSFRRCHPTPTTKLARSSICSATSYHYSPKPRQSSCGAFSHCRQSNSSHTASSTSL
jgi:hypothetical protein